jgi:hypothetical protein
MNSQQAAEVVQRLYDQIFGSLTQAPQGKPAYDTNRTFLTLCRPGLLISPHDFANPWSPGNPSGSQDAAKNLCDLVDTIPQFSALYADSNNRVSDLYGQLVRSTVTATSPPDPAQEKQYNNAWKFLHVKAKDPDTGEPTEIDAPIVTQYNTLHQAYLTAQSAYTGAYTAAMADPKLKGEWPLMGPALAAPVRAAWEAWRNNKADQVEAAQATLNTSGKDQIKRAFDDAQAVFQSYKLDFEGVGAMTPRSTVIPSNWYQTSNQNGWPTFSWAYSKSTSNTHSDYTSFGGGGGFSVGLWSVGGGAQHTSQNFHSDADAEKISVSYKYALITIRRAWLTNFLFGLPGWKTQIASKGGWSSGSRQGQQRKMFPLLPTAFIAVKDVNIMANFSHAELNQASSAMSASASVGWGPFSVSGNYAHGSSDQHVKGEIAPGRLSMPAVQIIGWICEILPLCPPE